MHYTPSTSPPSLPFALLGCAMGVYLATIGVKVVIKRETKIGPKGGPYSTVYGKEAFYAGLCFLLIGLFFVVFGLLSLVYLYKPHWFGGA